MTKIKYEGIFAFIVTVIRSHCINVVWYCNLVRSQPRFAFYLIFFMVLYSTRRGPARVGQMTPVPSHQLGGI